MRQGQAACWGRALPGRAPGQPGWGARELGEEEGALPLSLIHMYILVSSHVPGAVSGAIEEGGNVRWEEWLEQ